MFVSRDRGSTRDAPSLLEEFAGVADHIQRSLMALRLPHVPGIEIGVRAAPARVVGGDYVDVISLKGRPPLFTIGDVSGKSLPAALKAMTLRTLVRGLSAVLGDDLATIVKYANVVVCEDIEIDSFVTFAAATLTEDLRTFRVVNAGHDPAIIYRASSTSVEQIPESGIVLGIDAARQYDEQTVALEPGDIVALYTDGFTEARNPEGEQFTLAHVKEGLLEYRDLQAQALADALFDSIERYSAGTLRDDASILLFRILG